MWTLPPFVSLVMVLDESECASARNFALAKPENLNYLFRIGTAFSAKGAYGGKFLNLLDDAGLRGSLQLRIHREG